MWGALDMKLGSSKIAGNALNAFMNPNKIVGVELFCACLCC